MILAYLPVKNVLNMRIMANHFLFFGMFLLTMPLKAQDNYTIVYNIFQEKCASCHNPNTKEAGLDLVGSGATVSQRMASVYDNIVEVIPRNQTAIGKGDRLIAKGRADKSYLFRKVNAGLESTLELEPTEGETMPLQTSGKQLSDFEKEIIRQWILYGAPEKGESFDVDVVAAYFDEGGSDAFPNGAPSAPHPDDGFQIKMGPFYIEKGGEVEFFQKWELSLPADVDVTGIDFKISNYSHHFLLYYFENQGESVSPGLRLDQNHSDIGLFAAVQEATDMQLPGGTAFRWRKDIVLDLNSHYINYSFTQVYKAEVYLNVYTAPSGSAPQEMLTTLIPNLSIFIPNDGSPRSFSAPIVYGPGEIFVWGMMGHTHKYGRSYKVFIRNPDGTKGEPIYDASCGGGIPGCVSPFYDYQHIPLRFFSPLLPIKLNPGLIHEASYVNDGPRSVFWGPTSEDEMMLLGIMYTLDTAGVITSTKQIVDKPITELKLYPNPVESILYLENQANLSEICIRIFSLDGKLLRESNFLGEESIQMDVSQLSAGMYYYHLLADGVRSQSGKFVKL